MSRSHPRRGSSFRLFLVCFVILGALAGWLTRVELRASLLLAYLVGINVATLCAYFYDKAVAGHAFWRVPEALLHLLTIAGGSPAALVSQAAFRHKTVKRSFRTWFWGIVVLQAVLLGTWAYYGLPK